MKPFTYYAVRFFFFLVTPGIFTSIPAMTQNIVTYPAPSKEKHAAMPDFKNAAFGINFTGAAAEKMQQILQGKKVGARKFNVDSNRCPSNPSSPLVCVSYSIRQGGAIFGYGTAFSSGRRGGIGSTSSMSGNLVVVELKVELLQPNRDPVLLGSCDAENAAGYGGDSTYSYDRHGSGSFSSYGQTPLGLAAGVALGKCMSRQFGDNFGKAVFDSAAHPRWYPGAYEAVKAAFPESK
ncbi:MAG TPA: hypothetical protein VMT99_02680 [Candidatus Paceibacterota bacterium]|nr:hypothetical protein [Candidatus Paceibacterota bacterium]